MALKVLYIDDNVDNVDLFRMIFSECGIEIALSVANDGPSGFQLALEERPDIIFCDIGLPGMDGHELLRRLRAEPTLRNTCVVACTAECMAGDRERFLKAGFDVYLPKPVFDEQQVLSILLRRAAELGTPTGELRPPASQRAVTRVLLVENDTDQARPFIHALADDGFHVTHVGSASRALKAIDSDEFDLAVLDILMPTGKSFHPRSTAGGTKTGLSLAREIRKRKPGLPLVALTYSEDREVRDWFGRDKSVLYLHKSRTKPAQLPRLIRRRLGLGESPLKMFIVHGRDHAVVDELRGYLRDTLGLGDPVILGEQPSLGRTWIEQLEHHVEDMDLVFVLMTPDDIGGLSGSVDAPQERARQNVIFEYGFFLGALRRHSGRVLLLHKGQCEVPSDIGGVAYIDITGGVRSADRAIRKELSDWLS
jgi:CheY-like chemotaxis protein